MANATKNYAPIALFVYDRPCHTSKVLESLIKNDLAEESRLFIYSDGPRNGISSEKVEEVRRISHSIKGFKSVKIEERDVNWGLADNIISGTTDIIGEFQKIIVLEDDIVTSPFFLKYMNDALSRYEERKKVMHICGYNYPISAARLPETFFWRVMHCWGWATWNDRWNFFERDPEDLYGKFSEEEIWRFNLDGSYNYWKQVEDNLSGALKTWAIFWYAAIFKKKGFCLHPTKSLVENIGLDGSGTNCLKTKRLKTVPSLSKIRVFPKILSENRIAVERIKEFLREESMPPIKFLRRIAKRLLPAWE